MKQIPGLIDPKMGQPQGFESGSIFWPLTFQQTTYSEPSLFVFQMSIFSAWWCWVAFLSLPRFTCSDCFTDQPTNPCRHWSSRSWRTSVVRKVTSHGSQSQGRLTAPCFICSWWHLLFLFWLPSPCFGHDVNVRSCARFKGLIIVIKAALHAGALPVSLDTIGNCQRPVFSLGVSQHMHKITNLWKFELNWSSKLRDINERKKNTLVTRSCVLSDAWFRDLLKI